MIKGLKKNDTVLVLSGKDRGKSGKIVRVFPKLEKIIVDGVNTVRKHRRPKRSGEKGSVVQVAMPLRASNVLLKCAKCGAATRIAWKVVEGSAKVRVCKKCSHEF